MLFSSFSRTRPRRENLGKCYLSLKMSSCSWYSVKSLWKRRFCPITGRSSFNSSLFRKPCTKNHKSILRMYYLPSWIYLIELFKIHAFFPAWRGLYILCSYSAYMTPRIKNCLYIYIHSWSWCSLCSYRLQACSEKGRHFIGTSLFQSCCLKNVETWTCNSAHLRDTQDSTRAETVALSICLQFDMK